MDIEPEESLRDTIVGHINAAASEEPMEDVPEPVEDDVQSISEAVGDELDSKEPAPTSKLGRDETGKFTKTPKVKAPVVQLKPKLGKSPTLGDKPNLQQDLIGKDPAAPAPVTQFKAPQSWKPGVREKFATLPPEIQAEAVRVDREVQQVHRENATLKQSYGGFQQAMQPYAAMIQSSGQRPEQVFQSLLGTAHGLSYGSAPQKAQLVAHLIKSYGVDIQSLAAALDGAAPSPGAAPVQSFDPNQVAAQVRQQVMQDIQRQGTERLNSKATSEVDGWGQDKEYFSDLRELMAIELEADASRKQRLPDGHPAKEPISLDDAYERAALSHPEIAPIFEQRQEAERVTKANRAALSRRAAASSIRGQPAADVDSMTEPGENIRNDIIRAMNARNGR